VGYAGTVGVVFRTLSARGLSFLDISLLKDLLDDIVYIRSTEFILKCGFGSCVEGALSTVFVGDEDLEGIDNVCHWYALVLLPIRNDLAALDVDDEVVLLALEVDFGLVAFSFGHFGWFYEVVK